MESLDYIDSYFKGELDPIESGKFEEKIINDPAFAEKVADYVRIFQVAKEQSDDDKKERFRGLYQQNKTGKEGKGFVRRMWPTVAVAALVAGIIFGWYLFMQPVSPKQLADSYIREHLQSLSVTMGTQDSMQAANNLYNQEKLTESLQGFQRIIESDPSNDKAVQNAGIVSLRLQHYDNALEYFKQLERYKLEVNPALLYQSITLMKRNRPGDIQQAKQLLQQIEQNDLEGKEVAQKWLKKL